MPSKTLTIDPEFKSLIPPLTADERADLEASLKAEGCRDALVVWAGQGVLLDGHNRYEICQAHGIDFQTAERAFESRDHVIVWIVKNQLARRNLSQYARDEMVTQHMKPALLRMGLEKKKEGASNRGNNLVAETATSSEVEHKTDRLLAEATGTSERGIRQSSYIATRAPENLKAKARTGEVSRNRAYELTRLFEKLPEADRASAVELCGESEYKAGTLIRLHESAGQPDSNGTYDEILRTSGFHHGDDLEKWCDFKVASVDAINEALKSLSKHHAREERFARQDRRAELARSLTSDVFNVVYADPPWEYSVQNVNGAANNHYETMPLEEICALPETMGVKFADNAVLFLWTTNPFLVKALRVVEAWGFEYKTNIVWVKTELVKPGAGHYIRGRHELLYICTRGVMTPLVDVSPPIGSVIQSPIQEHSRKPDEVYSIIERLYPNCNYIELFARRARDGWKLYGDIAA